jgi:transcriptional regulator with PAS, ATPase and Fis domain
MPPPGPKTRFLTESLRETAPKLARAAAVELISKMLQRKHGNVRQAAAELGVSRATMNRWIASVPELATVLEQARG